jgi:MAE_28990/MAE_18760-like HEPN
MFNWDKEIEDELDWRLNEISAIKVQLIKTESQSIKYEALLRALVVLLYAHYEGFCKFAWDFYLDSIQKQQLKRKDCDEKIVWLSLSKEFKQLGGDLSSQGIWNFFTTTLPSSLEDNLIFSKESYLDTQSNLWPNLLKENSQKIGLSYDLADQHTVLLRTLVGRRNSIAHGRKDLIKDITEYERYEKAAIESMYELGLSVVKCLEERSYLK